LADRVTHQVGDALDLPFDDGAFDVVWTQNSGMNIADKARLYAGFRRVVRAHGRLVTQEPMAGPISPRLYPVMWADDPSNDHVRTQGAMRREIEAAGFTTVAWEEVAPWTVALPPSGYLLGPPPSDAPRPPRTVQSLVMGDDHLAAILSTSRQNEIEGRLTMVQAVFAVEPAP
jgi:SAM-dependent methyltransferase